ncbi:NADH-quinone oxidoreductase subunit B family protein [Roseomonas marmotae]|uniref:NADH-quinone oxidoreductase subunit NuoB n=1 Tax=Roseomonas marmotae TaxID=2768161 RepID=A0ABS3K996_9PROT|nr:NADH-quinone oxidoreductase subunit NuoB [Roseomonas marmotae]MBO1073592.1 NADH-quinone oxidoreductase subunit NuoB [Roseomonas marmotae]QTI80227.1 NADH-quinone oxidoreductase subunit NuoB [Roseomonas marmotae]
MLWPRLVRALLRPHPPEPAPRPHPGTVAALAERMEAAAQARLGRSLALMLVESGGSGGCALETRALACAVYDLERFGLRFVDSPREADLLLLAGSATRNMTEALTRAWNGMPAPKWAVAVGDCAAGAGPFEGSYALEEGGVGAAVPLDLMIPGCPPSPALILEGLLALLEAQAVPAAPQSFTEDPYAEGPPTG